MKKSRKWIMSLLQFGALIVIPPVYKLLSIDNDLTMIVLTSTTAISAAYLGANILAKKKHPPHE